MTTNNKPNTPEPCLERQYELARPQQTAADSARAENMRDLQNPNHPARADSTRAGSIVRDNRPAPTGPAVRRGRD